MLAIDAEAEEESGEESLEEREKLLGTVQAEIDAMKMQPRSSRQECIAKLAELELKMEQFHRTIAQRLHRSGHLAGAGFSAESVARRPSGLELEMGAHVDALLTPYREDADSGAGGRRDSAFKLRRKRSKRLDSPTRISPKPSRSWDTDLP